MNKRPPKKIGLFFSYFALVVFVGFCLYPAAWTVMSSFQAGDSLFSDTLIPKRFTFDHYRELFDASRLQTKQIPYLKWYANSLKVALGSMLLGTFLQLVTAYVLSKFRFKGRKGILSTVLVLGMFPSFMSIVAIYILLLQLNLMNSLWALIVVYGAGAPISMFVAKGFFDTIPKSLEDAARIDGASHWQVFAKIIFPMSRPIVTYIALTTFTGAFVDFILPRAILRTRDQFTLSVGLWEMVDNYVSTAFTLFAAGSVLTAIPVTLLFLFLQRFLVEGLTAGASKG